MDGMYFNWDDLKLQSLSFTLPHIHQDDEHYTVLGLMVSYPADDKYLQYFVKTEKYLQ